MAIKNIIFDLGGVVLNLDPKRTIEAFEELGFRDFKSKYNFPTQVELFDQIEVGTISGAEFYEGLRELFGVACDTKEMDRAWNAMLLDFPAERLRALKEVSGEYRTFLLSNTNEIHLKAYLGILERVHGEKDLSFIFEKEYYSHLVGMRKPDPAIFRLVLEEQGLLAEDTLFIDDAVPNIEAAKAVGLQTRLLHISDEEVSDLFVDGRLF